MLSFKNKGIAQASNTFRSLNLNQKRNFIMEIYLWQGILLALASHKSMLRAWKILRELKSQLIVFTRKDEKM